jgi:hypothetical protein
MIDHRHKLCQGGDSLFETNSQSCDGQAPGCDGIAGGRDAASIGHEGMVADGNGVSFGGDRISRGDRLGLRQPSKPRRLFGAAVLGRAAAVAAAACLLLAAGYMFFGSGASEASAKFAAMLDRVGTASSVTYDHVVTLQGRDSRATVTLTSDGKMRLLSESGQELLVDERSGRQLSINHSAKRVLVFDSPSAARSPEIERLRNVAPSSAVRVGRAAVDGLDATLYVVDHERTKLSVWIDDQSDLPVRIVSQQRESDGSLHVSRLENIRWNVTNAPAEISMQVPTGYKVVEPQPRGTEVALVATLRTMADLNDGQFPDAASSEALVQLMKRHPRFEMTEVELSAGAASGLTRINDAAARALRECMAAEAFIRKQGDSWRYVGEGVRAGDAAGAVCWWNADRKGFTRVMYGDFSLRTIKASALPPLLAVPSGPGESDSTSPGATTP